MSEAGMFRLMFAREAIASVSLSHPQSCECDICKAALGDDEAFMRVVEAMEEEEA